MKNNLSPHDFTKLSAYLDGELNASDSRKMESRLEHDPNLRAALDDLHETKNILQRIPKRRAPRNFTLSPQMVAKSPPMPRLVPALNFATALAMILFFFSILPPFGLGSAAMAPAPEMMDMAIEEFAAAEEAPAPEEEAFAEEEAMPMAEAPLAEEAEEAIEESSASVTEGDNTGATDAVESTPRVADDNEKTVAENQVEKSEPFATLPSSATLVATPDKEELREKFPTASFTLWQEILLAIIILFAISGFILRRAVMVKWQKKSS